MTALPGLREPRPFRFSVQVWEAATARELAERVRRIEADGYDVIQVADHFHDNFSTIATMMAIGAATTTVRVGSLVFANDWRHPVMLAKEAATIDVLTEGRLEFGIGAGWKKEEYEDAGQQFDPPGTRLSRLIEAVGIIKRLWGPEPVTHDGVHYRVGGLEGLPKPIQQPHPPIVMGGGGRQLLSFAARKADQIGLIARALPDGGMDMGENTEEALAEKVGWVREAAGARVNDIELSLLIWDVAITDDARAAADSIRRASWNFPDATVEDVLRSPYALVGSVEEIAEKLHRLREQFGVSHFCVGDDDLDAFTPIVRRLAGE